MAELPISLNFFFFGTTLLTWWLLNRCFYKSNLSKAQRSWVNAGLFGWVVLQSLLASLGLYSNHLDNFPLSILPLATPAILLIVILFMAPWGKSFLDSLSLECLTWISVVRIPVEIILFLLFLEKVIPEEMTFAGHNFDILAGLTAPIIAYLGIRKNKMGRLGLLVWNILSLILLLVIMGTAVLSAPFPIQQMGFDQPNIAVLHFPYCWLPSFIVPIVLFSHLASIRKLIKKHN